MNGGGANFPPPSPNGGDFLLSLLQKPSSQSQPQPQPPPPQQSHTIDPAVAMMGPTITISTSSPWQQQTNGHDHLNLNPNLHHNLSPWSHTLSPSYPNNIFGLTHNPFHLPYVPEFHYSNNTINGVSLTEDLRRLGFPIDVNNSVGVNVNSFVQQQQQQQQQELKLKFGSLPTVSFDKVSSNGNFNGFDRNSNNNHEKGVIGNFRSIGQNTEQIRVPPGFVNNTKGKGHLGYSEVGDGELSVRNMENVRMGFGERSNNRGNVGDEFRLPDQIDHPGPPSGSNLHSDYVDVGVVGEQLADSLLLEDELDDNSSNTKKRHGRKEKVNT